MERLPKARRDLVGLTVLALLAEEARHPYEMLRLIRERHKDFVTGLPRSLYHAVERLLRAELIEPAETSREGRRPERTVYRVTDDGREELDAWVSDLLAYPASEQPLFTAAVSFLPGLTPAVAAGALRVRLAGLEGQIAAIDAQLRAFQEHLPRIVLLEEEFTRALRQTEVEWVRAVIDDIRSGRLAWDFEQLKAASSSFAGSTDSAQQGSRDSQT